MVRSLNATKPSRVTGAEIGPGDVHLPLERVRLLGRCQSNRRFLAVCRVCRGLSLLVAVIISRFSEYH